MPVLSSEQWNKLLLRPAQSASTARLANAEPAAIRLDKPAERGQMQEFSFAQTAINKCAFSQTVSGRCTGQCMESRTPSTHPKCEICPARSGITRDFVRWPSREQFNHNARRCGRAQCIADQIALDRQRNKSVRSQQAGAARNHLFRGSNV